MTEAINFRQIYEDADDIEDTGQDDDTDGPQSREAWLAEQRRQFTQIHPRFQAQLRGYQHMLETGRVPKETPTQGKKEIMNHLAPTFADFADQYLNDRGHGVNGQYRLRHHQGQWLRYNGVQYEPLAERDLRADVMNYFTGTPLKSRVNGAFVSGIIEQLIARCLVPTKVCLPALQGQTQPGIPGMEGEAWYEDRETVTLQNGLIDLAGVHIGIVPKLRPHSPQFVSLSALPYSYEPGATCPTWVKFLEEILPDASRTLLQQIFGYCLTPDMSLQKFFMFEGTGGNGKSVVTSILRRVVGTNNTSSVPLNRFGDKHSLVSTYGKLVNVTGELREKDNVAEDLLKQATGGDVMHFEAKYKDAFSAPFTAKIIICTNERPAFTDRSNGLWRRLVVLPFTVSIPQDKQDARLEDKLANELPGILNWAIQGAVSLHKSGRFEEPQASIEARTDFQKDANPARQFLDECCRLDPEGRVETRVLYTQYREYVSSHGHAPLSDTKFRKEVESLPGVTKERTRVDGVRPHVYQGICPCMPGL